MNDYAINAAKKQTKTKSGGKKPPRGNGPMTQHEAEIVHALHLMSGGQKPKSKPNKPRTLNAFDNPQKMRPKPGVMRGMSYGDGFDKVSAPEREIVEVKEFDELIPTAILGSVAFAITPFAINPGQSAVFPRLSKLAVLYERYRFKKLEFYFQHDVSPFNAQGAAGLVIVSGLYDASSATPTLKSQVEVSQPHVICMPNENSLCRFNPKRLHPQGLPLFVRPGVLPGGSDIKTYDAGNCFVTTQGMAGATEVGELHVRGVVEFIGDILDSSAINAPVNNQVATFTSTAGETITTSVTLQLLMAGASVNPLGITNNAGALVLPAGNYLIDYDGHVTFTGSGTLFGIGLKKNGAFTGPIGIDSTFVAATNTTVSLHQTVFYTSNGTDSLTLTQSAIFTTGAATGTAMVRIVAI